METTTTINTNQPNPQVQTPITLNVQPNPQPNPQPNVPPAGFTPQPTPQPTPAPQLKPTQNTVHSGEIETTVNYTRFVFEKMLSPGPEKKTIVAKDQNAGQQQQQQGQEQKQVQQHYYQIPLMYDYGHDNIRRIDELHIELCEMESRFGIQTKTGMNGYPESSIMVMFNPSDPVMKGFIDFVDRLHYQCGVILAPNKGFVKMPNFNHTMAEATGLKHILYRPTDPNTGEIISGRSPSMFLKLFKRGKQSVVQTLFTSPDNKPIPWKLLENVEMKFIPLVHFKRIYVGTKTTIQLEVSSAVVTSVKARNATSRQTETFNRLNESRPELADLVAAQLAKLTLDRQDALMDHNQGNEADEHDSSQPTFNGVVATNKSLSGPPQSDVGQPMPVNYSPPGFYNPGQPQQYQQGPPQHFQQGPPQQYQQGPPQQYQQYQNQQQFNQKPAGSSSMMSLEQPSPGNMGNFVSSAPPRPTTLKFS